MFCQKCGHQLKDEAIFCVQCGTKRIVEAIPPKDTTTDTKENELLMSGGGVATTTSIRWLTVPISIVLAFGSGALGLNLATQFGYATATATTTTGPGWFGGILDDTVTVETLYRTPLYALFIIGGIALGCFIGYFGYSFRGRSNVRTEIHVYNTGLAGIADGGAEGIPFDFFWSQIQGVQAKGSKLIVTALGVYYEINATNAAQIAALTNEYIRKV